jgi:hypothetical protein
MYSPSRAIFNDDDNDGGEKKNTNQPHMAKSLSCMQDIYLPPYDIQLVLNSVGHMEVGIIVQGKKHPLLVYPDVCSRSLQQLLKS